jgi:hypothetical protein
MQGVSRAAEPLLAGTMMGDEGLDHVFERFELGDENMQRLDGNEVRVGTGKKSVDDAFGGGVCGGNVLGVWGEGGEVGVPSIHGRW